MKLFERIFRGRLLILLFLPALGLAGCTTSKPGTMASRKGDEIVVAGHFVHTGTPVVTWMDPGGYDAYRVERRFSPIGKSDWEHSADEVQGLRTPNRYSLRASGLSDAGNRESSRGWLGFAVAATSGGPIRNPF